MEDRWRRTGLVMAIVLWSAQVSASEHSERTMRRFLTRAGVASIESPERVEVVSVTRLRAKKPARHVAGYPLTGEYIEVPEDLREDLRGLLTVPANYSIPEWPPSPSRRGGGYGTGCGFNPGYSLRFRSTAKGKRRAFDMLVCFMCNEIGVVVGQNVVKRDMGPMSVRLARVFFRLFPDDKRLRQIATGREPLVSD